MKTQKHFKMAVASGDNSIILTKSNKNHKQAAVLDFGETHELLRIRSSTQLGSVFGPQEKAWVTKVLQKKAACRVLPGSQPPEKTVQQHLF